jgi:hypothetical protein
VDAIESDRRTAFGTIADPGRLLRWGSPDDHHRAASGAAGVPEANRRLGLSIAMSCDSQAHRTS